MCEWAVYCPAGPIKLKRLARSSKKPVQ